PRQTSPAAPKRSSLTNGRILLRHAQHHAGVPMACFVTAASTHGYSVTAGQLTNRSVPADHHRVPVEFDILPAILLVGSLINTVRREHRKWRST
ncbi:hypothetical protein M9978_16855, partial [Sphingomonas sp. MG17]